MKEADEYMKGGVRILMSCTPQYKVKSVGGPLEALQSGNVKFMQRSPVLTVVNT